VCHSLPRFFSKILETLPFDCIEHIFSFCSGKDLLRLKETCTRFRDVVAASVLLMRKLRIVIDMKLHPAEEDAIVKMSQRFSAARVDFVHSKYTPDWSAKQGRTLAISAKLKGIKDLVIDGHEGSILLQVLQLACHLLPQAKVCKMKFQRDREVNWRTRNAVRDHFSTASFQLAKCDFLTDLQVEHCCIDFLTRVLLESKHLKRLSIEDGTFHSESFNINGTSVWELVTFKLEKLELFIDNPVEFDETFKEFLAKQTDLREILIRSLTFRVFIGCLRPNQTSRP
jgi:F-box domain